MAWNGKWRVEYRNRVTDTLIEVVSKPLNYALCQTKLNEAKKTGRYKLGTLEIKPYFPPNKKA